ncbi:AraC family transcriptional regulator [Chitinophaga sp. MM2321]|uniref:AraC family transcriptional regulator n=1 Tax=Chitinophaga sp. MM2321 TaxID=3137178 RepID=UPI0032D5804D
MQPALEKIFLSDSSSIAVKREITDYMDYPWHYHPEYEIIFVEKSYGIRFMGNHIGNFTDGDLMFIGANLPHVWRNDKDFYQHNEDLKVDVYVIHFQDDSLSSEFFNLVEFTHIKKLFLRAQQGVLINGNDHKEISELIKQVYHSSGIDRLTLFLKTLDKIANTKDYELLSSPGYANSVNMTDTERINKVMNFLMKNYNRDIKIEEVAELVNLSKASFCRYFKSRTNKTCFQLLNEIRILNACKLLIKSDMTITEISYESGYNNLSHFNRQFRLITGLTAKAYARKYLKDI